VLFFLSHGPRTQKKLNKTKSWHIVREVARHEAQKDTGSQTVKILGSSIKDF
jgi:hypothetical protein